MPKLSTAKGARSGVETEPAEDDWEYDEENGEWLRWNHDIKGYDIVAEEFVPESVKDAHIE